MASLDLQINQHLQNLKGNMMRPAGPQPGFGMQGGPPMQVAGPPFGMPGGPQQQPMQVQPMVGGKGGPPPGQIAATLLSVAIDNIACRYQLSEADVGETFQRWGQLQNVQIYRGGSRDVGVVTFADSIDASDAQRQLNGQTCNFENNGAGTLVVVQGSPEQLSGPPIPQNGPQFAQGGQGALMGPPGQGPPPQQVLPPGQGPPMASPCGPLPGSQPAQPVQPVPPAQPGQLVPPSQVNGSKDLMDVKGGGKGSNGGAVAQPPWSCKVIVQAEKLHPSFPMALKINGPNNANVEHMRSQLHVSVQLRGRSSGFLEADGQELQENMALWFSAEKPELGPPAVDMAKDLLGSVYEEHKQFCILNGHPAPPNNIEPTILQGPTGNPAASAPGAAAAMGPGPGPATIMASGGGPGGPGMGIGGPGPAGFQAFDPSGGKGGGGGPCMMMGPGGGGPAPGMMMMQQGPVGGKGGPFPGMPGGGPGMPPMQGMPGMQGGGPMGEAPYGMVGGKGGGFGPAPTNDGGGGFAGGGKGGFQPYGK